MFANLESYHESSSNKTTFRILNQDLVFFCSRLDAEKFELINVSNLFSLRGRNLYGLIRNKHFWAFDADLHTENDKPKNLSLYRGSARAANDYQSAHP